MRDPIKSVLVSSFLLLLAWYAFRMFKACRVLRRTDAPQNYQITFFNLVFALSLLAFVAMDICFLLVGAWSFGAFLPFSTNSSDYWIYCIRIFQTWFVVVASILIFEGRPSNRDTKYFYSFIASLSAISLVASTLTKSEIFQFDSWYGYSRIGILFCLLASYKLNRPIVTG